MTPKEKVLSSKKVGKLIEGSILNKINRRTTPLAKNEREQRRYAEAQDHQQAYRDAMKRRWG